MKPLLTDAVPLRPLLALKPCGIISDIDGTISPIALRPEDAYVPEEMRALLQALNSAGLAIGFVTGRPLDEARRRVPMHNAVYAGNHGLDVWFAGKHEAAPGVAKYVGQAQAVIAYLERLPLPGVRIENKGPIVALHYRLSPEPENSRRAILAAVAATPAAAAFCLHEGKKIVELRPPLFINKGTSTVDFVRRLSLRSVICLGDDVTDIDMFVAVTGLRAESAIEGACIAVDSGETPATVLEAADFRVNGVDGVRGLLQALLTELA